MAVSPEIVREWLLNIARQQDVRSFRHLFDYYYQDAYRTAYFFVKDKELAEEVVSDVFMRIWDRRTEADAILHPRSYILKAVKYASLNYRQKHQPVYIAVDEVIEEPHLGLTPEQDLIWSDMQQTLEGAITALPPRCQLIFRMVREQQLSYREVADTLDIAPKTVEVQMGIALKRLNELIQTMDLRTSIGKSYSRVVFSFFLHLF